MNERKYYSPEDNVKIVLEGLNGTIQISNLCRKYDIKPARFYNWKENLLKNSPSIFYDHSRKNTSSEKRNEELHTEIIGLKDTIAEITTENLELRKRLETHENKTLLFYDIHSTVEKTSERSRFPISRILRILGISEAWYYRNLDPTPILDMNSIPFQ